MSSLYEQEIAKLDRHLDAGIITTAEYKDRAADAKARHGIGGTQPPTTGTTATAATAAPRRSAKESLASAATTPQPKGKCKWLPQEMPEPLDAEGRPITEGLSVITVRAVEGGRMVPDKEKGGKAKKWEGSGLPGGKIAIGTGWRNELTLTPVQFLQMYAEMEKIHDAIMGTTDPEGNAVPGLLDDSQPRDILVV